MLTTVHVYHNVKTVLSSHFGNDFDQICFQLKTTYCTLDKIKKKSSDFLSDYTSASFFNHHSFSVILHFHSTTFL